jgi:flagellar protein FliJ
MRRFKFKLQSLLELRAAREKEIQGELSKLLSIQNIERVRQEDYRRRMSEEHRKLSDRIRGGMYSYSEAMAFERFIEFAGRVIKTTQEKIEAMEPGIREVRGRLIEASKDRKVIERLKDKKWKEYLYELNRETIRENEESNHKIFEKMKREEVVSDSHADRNEYN